MFTLCRIALLSARKPSRIAGLLFTYKNDDFGAVSVTKLICAAPISKVERHISDRFCARLWCSVNRKRSRSRSDDYREIKIHVYAKRQREFVPREQVFPYFPFTRYCFYAKISNFMPVLSFWIVLNCFYLLIFYSENWIWRLPFAVNVNLNLSNDSAVCDDSPAETTTSDLPQLTTVLQRDINGKSYSFSQCPQVLIPLLRSEI